MKCGEGLDEMGSGAVGGSRYISFEDRTTRWAGLFRMTVRESFSDQPSPLIRTLAVLSR